MADIPEKPSVVTVPWINGRTKLNQLNMTGINDNLTNIKTAVDGVIDVLEEVVESAPVKEATYSELKALRDGSQLIPGQQYRITDYQCTTTSGNTSSAGHQFDIIVTADGTNKLNEKARAALHSGDTYFANSKLDAWQLWYCLDNDTTRFGWAQVPVEERLVYGVSYFREPQYDGVNGNYCWWPGSGNYYIFTDTLNAPTTGSRWKLDGSWIKWSDSVSVQYAPAISVEGQGVIYRMIDEFGNDVPYDFKNILFTKANAYTNAYTFTYKENNVVKDASILGLNKGCYSNIMGKYIALNKQILNFNVFYSSSTSFNCYNNTVGDNFYGNKIGRNSHDNTIDNDFHDNTIGTFFSNNAIGNNFYNNIIGNDFYSNAVGDNFYNNTIGNYFYYDTIGNRFYGNTVGDSFRENTIGNNFYSNAIGNDFYSNTVGNDFRSNAIGNTFYNNAIGNFFYDNTISNGSTFYSNAIGNNFYGNTVSSNFRSNAIGNDFNNNAIGNNFYGNTVGNSFNSNVIGNYFYRNTIGNQFESNTIGVSTSDNIYVRYCKFDDGVQYVSLTSDDTSAASSNCIQNVHVHSGVMGASSSALLTISVPDRNLPYSIDYYFDSNGNLVTLDDRIKQPLVHRTVFQYDASYLIHQAAGSELSGTSGYLSVYDGGNSYVFSFYGSGSHSATTARTIVITIPINGPTFPVLPMAMPAGQKLAVSANASSNGLWGLASATIAFNSNANTINSIDLSINIRAASASGGSYYGGFFTLPKFVAIP